MRRATMTLTKTAGRQDRKWYWYLGLILVTMGGLLAAYYSIMAVFLVFGSYSPIFVEGELSWRLIGIIIGAYIMLWAGVSLIKRRRKGENNG
jgi:hypothetical protein